MKYEARVTLTKVQYTGDNVGRNLRLKLTIGEKTEEFGFELPVGQTRAFDKLVYKEQTDSNSVALSASAAATERDPVYADTGSGSGTLRFSATSETEATFEVEVQGDARGDKSNKAKLVLTFTGILRKIGERFVSMVQPEGWLKIKHEDSTTYPRILPYGVRVTVTSNDGEREFFDIEEGQLKGKKASVLLKPDKTSYLQEKNPQTGPISLHFSKRDNILTMDGVRYWAVTDPGNPVPSGSFDLEIAYELHSAASGYRDRAAYARTWFRIGHSGDRFLHTGSISSGCVTVRQVDRWDEICSRGFIARKDQRSIGQIVVSQ